MLGLVLGRLLAWPLNHGLVLGAGVGFAFVSTLAACRPILWATLLAASAMFTAASWCQLVRNRIPEWEGRAPREAVLAVQVERLFAGQEDPRKAGGLGRVTEAPPHLALLVGQTIQFSGRSRPGVPRLVRSSAVEMAGQLEVVPRMAPPSTFDGYLSGAGVNFKLTRARILREHSPPGPYWKWCDRMQSEMGERVGVGLEAQPALVGVLRAVLLGSVGELSERQDGWFTQSGTLHLFSVSGLHIGVIAMALSGVLAALRVPAWVRFIVILILLWLYVDITGRAPSAVRAFLMVAWLQFAKVMRLPPNNMSLLVSTAMLVLVVDPLQLFSASFQMSYGIVLALIALGLPMARAWDNRHPIFHDRPQALWTWRHRLFDSLRKSVIGAVALGMATLPVNLITGVLTFGLATPGALIANLVSIPLASIGLLGGFSSLVASACGERSLSIVFNHASALALTVVDQGAERIVQIPGISMAASFRAPIAGYLALVVLMGLLLSGLQTGWARRTGGFWPPFVFTGLVVIFLVTFSHV
ncbi:MAG: ComEC/Rec2 family competence protein [Opitutaceae bacterium]|nr:ComEC/Rec2 family competence protein [Opitutaceae bacterium]